jgi:hypothetical protein
MLRAALLLDMTAIAVVFSEISAKFQISAINIPIPEYQLRATQEIEFTVITAGITLIPLIKIIHDWIRGGYDSLHFWNLVAAFCSLLGKS